MIDLLHNQLIGGGLVLMLTGAVMALLRKAPLTLFDWIQDRLTVSVLISDRDPLFEWTKLWLDSIPYSQKARRLMCSLLREEDEEFSAQSRMIFAPSYGRHFFRYRRRWLWMDYVKPDKPDVTIIGGRGNRGSETIKLTILGFGQGIVRSIVKEIADFAAEDAKRQVRGFISSYGWWRRMPQFKARELSTVDLPAADEQRVVAAIKEFLGARKIYAERGIPYHLNLLFAGLPGTGKTSIASALCGYFGLNLYLLNIAGPGMNDERLVDLVLSLPRRSMLLMEDVDAVVPDRTKKPKTKDGDSDSPKSESEGVTLSGLLNCMDGITAPDGAIIVMTTNHPEFLDPALLRPGRVDIRVDFGAATREQIERMYYRLRPNTKLNGEVDVMLTQRYTTAQVQAEILTRISGAN